MKELEYILNKYKLNGNQKKQPIEIKNTNRETLAKLFYELGYTQGAEIGVEEGIYSEVLCQNNPNLHLFCVDAWTPYKGYRDHTTKKQLNLIYDNAVRRLKPYNCTLIKGFSVEVAEDIKDESLDFVYIDANHEFCHVVNDIIAWEKKVRVGGIIAGHDYIKRRTNPYLMHVIPAIHGYCDAYEIKPLFVLGRKVYPKGELRDKPRSWFYVKPTRDLIKYKM